MPAHSFNKLKVFNDPIYGFISIPGTFIFDLIEHPDFQRLRRIRQLGLTAYVYPGALHTRFHHALGAMYLMGTCLEVLRSKGQTITAEEAEAATIAILLHDIGHGPFSHALEGWLIPEVSHEEISWAFMQKLNLEFNGKLSLALEIFKGTYHKKFLHYLVSSQLDMDRLDYLKRDSFFTGVSEGTVNSDRIITMLRIVNDQLVVDAKGIYSVEKFIIARRLMYWQVYLHKTVISAEQLLVKILQRARLLTNKGVSLFATPALNHFLPGNIFGPKALNLPGILASFAAMDDEDIFVSIKQWQSSDDKILSLLSKNLVNRHLFQTEIARFPFSDAEINRHKVRVMNQLGIDEEEVTYFVSTGRLINNAYDPSDNRIGIYYRDGSIVDITEAADQLNISVLSGKLEKYFLCYPKESIH
jgi:uncharacterized protein